MAAEAFFKLKRSWVIEKMARQKEKYKDVQPASDSEVEQLWVVCTLTLSLQVHLQYLLT